MALGTTNITTTLIANTIGVGSNDVGTLCASNKVNKWSKYKPIRLNKLSGVTLDDQINNNFSFDLDNEVSTSPETASLKNWAYLKPTGGATSQYRMGDFRGYYHQALPLMNLIDNFSSINIYGYNTFKIRVSDADNTISGQINMSDFTKLSFNISSWIPCILVKYNSTIYTYKYTGETSVTGAKYITLDFTTAPFNGITDNSDMTFMYLLASDPDKISGTCYYLPMPFAETEPCNKTVTIYNHQSITATFLQVSSVYNTGYEDITFYSGPTQEDSLYFLVPRNIGSVYYKIKLHNSSTSTETIDLSYLTLEYTNLFTSYQNLKLRPSCYDASFNSVDIINSHIITIPANTDAYFYIGIPSALLMTSQTEVGPAVVTGIKISSSITLYFTNNTNEITLAHVSSLRLQSN
jgi:hypothetical protein